MVIGLCRGSVVLQILGHSRAHGRVVPDGQCQRSYQQDHASPCERSCVEFHRPQAKQAQKDHQWSEDPLHPIGDQKDSSRDEAGDDPELILQSFKR